jgi:DNA-directed RNA polymerase specialized sigma24 family protein
MGTRGPALAPARPSGDVALGPLLARLGTDPDVAGGEYRRLHRRLVAFFESHGSLEPGRDADETLDRLARKLGEGHVIRDVPAYVHGLARNVLRESWRRAGRERAGREAMATRPPPEPAADGALWRCFERCLAELEPAPRELLLAYYSAAQTSNRAWRAELAATRGLSLNALRIRVFRAREDLRERLRRCLGATEDPG